MKYDKHWEEKESVIKLTGWKKERRIIIVRKRRPENKVLRLEKEIKERQTTLALIEEPENIKAYEYSVLATSLDNDVVAIIDHYRHRASCENNFDEIKNLIPPLVDFIRAKSHYVNSVFVSEF